jgi:hypothetical protein
VWKRRRLFFFLLGETLIQPVRVPMGNPIRVRIRVSIGNPKKP